MSKAIMSQRAILEKAAKDLRIMEINITDKTETGYKTTEARYMIFELMEKAGYTHQQIADYFKMNRENVTKGLSKLEVWKGAYKDVRDRCGRLELLILNAA